MSRSSRVRRTNSCCRSMLAMILSACFRCVTTPPACPLQATGTRADRPTAGVSEGITQAGCKNLQILLYSCGMSRRLAEVARKVNVSEATVSRVLNGKPGVSEATREAVLTALDVLGYERPTKLRGERARLVGLVLPELQNPIFPAFAEVVGGALAQQGFTPVLCTRTVAGTSDAEYLELLLQHQVSGIVLAGGLYAQAEAAHDHYARLAERRLPTVLVNASIEGIDFPRVSCDDVVAIEQAFGHLLALGHERIGLVLGPTDHVPSRRKLAAFLAAEVNGSDVEHTIFTTEGGEAGATRLV